MSFLRQAVITLITRGGLLVVTFAYNILLSRTLQAEGIGIVGTLQTFANIAVQLGNLGLAVGAIYFVGLDRKRASAVAGTLVTIGLLISIILFAGFLAVSLLSPAILGDIEFSLYPIMLISVAPLLLSIFFQNLLLVYQKITAYNMIELAVRFATLIAAMIVLLNTRREDWVLAVVWLTVASAIAMGLFNGIFAWTAAPFSLRIDWKAFRDMIGYGWKSYYASFMAFLIIRSDILFLNAYRSETETGIYRQVVYTSDLVYLIPMTLGTLLFPKLMQNGASEETGYDSRARLTMVVARLVGFILMVMWVLFVFIGRWFLGIFGPEFTDGYIPLNVLLGGILFLGIESILAAELARRGLPIFVVVYSTICVIVKIVGNVLLVPPYGMYGAAWSSLATHFVFLALVLWYCVRYYGFNVRDTLFIQRGDFELLAERLKLAMRRQDSTLPPN